MFWCGGTRQLSYGLLRERGERVQAQRLRLAQRFPGPIASGIKQDSHKPGTRIGPRLELLPRPKGFETGLLHQIFRLVPSLHQAAGTTPQQGQVWFGHALKVLRPVLPLGHDRPQNR